MTSDTRPGQFLKPGLLLCVYPGRPQRSGGFTLIELIVTLLVVGILAVVVLPTMFERRTFDALRYYDQTLAATRYAQKIAIAQKRTSGVFVLVGGGSLRVCLDAGCATPVADPTSPGPMTLTAPGGAGISATAASFSFNALGQPSSGPITVSVSASGEPTRTFVVEAETGYVHP